jgi:anti-sigma-K factor RskA
MAEDGSMRILASYDAADGALLVRRERGTPPPVRVLELWLIAGGAAPVSLGVLPHADDVRLDTAEGLRPQLDSGIFAISDEPLGGSTTGAPTGAVLATGAITSL